MLLNTELATLTTPPIHKYRGEQRLPRTSSTYGTREQQAFKEQRDVYWAALQIYRLNRQQKTWSDATGRRKHRRLEAGGVLARRDIMDTHWGGQSKRQIVKVRNPRGSARSAQRYY